MKSKTSASVLWIAKIQLRIWHQISGGWIHLRSINELLIEDIEFCAEIMAL